MVVPQDALTSSFLLNAIFSITSLHAATTSAPARVATYQVAALEYQNLAITTFQAENPLVTPSNHRAMFAFSVINLALAVALPYNSPTDTTSTDIHQGVRTMFRLLKGVISIFSQCRTWLVNGPFQAVVARPEIGMNTDRLDAPLKAAMKCLKSANDEGYRRLYSDASSSPYRAVQYHQSNVAAITKLERCFSSLGDDGWTVCLRWLSTLDNGFVEAISEREPVAILVTMHWAILLHKLGEEKWWATSSGKLLVTELSMSLRFDKPEWQAAISWVHEQVDLPPLTPRD